LTPTRRAFLAALTAPLAHAAVQPANRNVKWALSLGLWNHFRPCPFTDILDLMRDTGFIGIRLTGFPGCLKTYSLTAAQMESEVSRRGLHVVTISFSPPSHDPARRAQVLRDAREAMEFLGMFGAKHLVVFSPSRRPPGENVDTAFHAMCDCFNRIGELAGEMGFRAGLHNHLDQMVERPEEVHRALALTDPKLFHFSPDTAHLHLGGGNVVDILERHKRRLMLLDYKDARWTTPAADVVLDNGAVHKRDSKSARFFSSIYDLGDGEIDFPACHRLLREISYRGWICVDLDTARRGPRASYERSARYVVDRLEPIYE
jgi:inosose dehydratase